MQTPVSEIGRLVTEGAFRHRLKSRFQIVMKLQSTCFLYAYRMRAHVLQRSPKGKFIMKIKGVLVAEVGFEPTTFRL